MTIQEERVLLDFESKIVGRREQVHEILDFLLPPPEGMRHHRERSVFLAIFGLAGVGKTTLAQLVYNDPRLRNYYRTRAWVCVSRSFDLKQIGRSIIKGLERKMHYLLDNADSINVLDKDDIDSIQQRIHGLLGYVNLLLVLDDIWERDQGELDRLNSLLGVGHQQSRRRNVDVIVTTRDEDIARRICTYNNDQPYKLRPLSDDQCCAVIMRTLGGRRDDEQDLDKKGLETLATKCGGLPIVAKAIGGYMLRQDMRDQEWLEIARTTDDLSIYGPTMDRLSLNYHYQSMQPNLRLCFAYLGTLPNRHNIAQDDIIHRWIALGLIEPTTNVYGIISRLLDISFLEHSNLASTSRRRDDNEGVISFTMHNLIHCFARSLMGSTLVVADGEHTRDAGTRCCRYAVLTNFGLASSKLSSVLPTELRALSLLGCSKMELRKDSFSSFKYLRVLELREPSMQKLPDSVCQLGLLGYLNLSGCTGLVQLPESFGNLTGMVHVNLSGCSGLVKLSESFGNLTNVMHVNLSGCSGLVELPESFGNLTNVIHVNLSSCIGLKSLPKSFGLLKKLEHLDLSYCSCLERIQSALGGLTNLQLLNLSHPCCYIVQHRCRLKGLNDVWEKLINLRYLNLSMCLNPILCYLPLPVEERNEYVGSISGLRSLEHLDLSHNIYLFDIPLSLGQLSQLQTLNLSGCIRLKRIDRWMGQQNFPEKSLVVSNCLGLETYEFVVRADRGAKSSNLSQLKDVSCKELEISCLEKVVSTEEAKSIRLAEKKKLQKLILVWSYDNGYVGDKTVLAELVPPQNLQYFELRGYGRHFLPDWMTSGLLSSHLPNLVEVTMVDIRNCRNLPPFGVLPNLQRLILRRVAKVTRIDSGCLSGGSKAAFHRLLHVTLDGMENLEEFSNSSSSSSDELVMFPTLDELVIHACPKLRFGGSPPKARMLVISDCDQLMSSAVKRRGGDAVEGPSSSTCTTSSPMTEVVIESCKVPLDKLNWNLLQGLAPVHSLHIRNCSEKIMSPEIMEKHLTSLELLGFSHCDSMIYLPEHVVQVPSLQKLVIDECRGIKSLPQSICEEEKEHYPLLRIRQCPELQKWCDGLEENKKRLARQHIIFEGESSSSEAVTSPKRTSSE